MDHFGNDGFGGRESLPPAEKFSSLQQLLFVRSFPRCKMRGSWGGEIREGQVSVSEFVQPVEVKVEINGSFWQ